MFVQLHAHQRKYVSRRRPDYTSFIPLERVSVGLAEAGRIIRTYAEISPISVQLTSLICGSRRLMGMRATDDLEISAALGTFAEEGWAFAAATTFGVKTPTELHRP